MRRGIVFVCLSWFAFASPSVHAVDGVVEINQARALAGGVTAGDAAGFPVTVSESGSYRLTGNLTVPDENTTAIDVTVDGVFIDLNGFSIVGPGDETSANGTGSGIRGAADLTVIDGTIRGLGATAVTADSRAHIERVNAVLNGTGIVVGFHSHVLEVNANRNRVFGIQAGPRSLVKNSIVNKNASHGINGTTAVSYLDNVIQDNGGRGIITSDNCNVQRNTVVGNASRGLSLGDGCGYGGNIINENNGGNGNPQIGVSGGSVIYELSTNVCGGDTVCP